MGGRISGLSWNRTCCTRVIVADTRRGVIPTGISHGSSTHAVIAGLPLAGAPVRLRAAVLRAAALRSLPLYRDGIRLFGSVEFGIGESGIPMHMPTSGFGGHELAIEECTLVASGTKRNVYEHRDLPGLLIKTLKPELLDGNGHERSTPWWKKTRPFGAYGVFLREFSEFVGQCRRGHAAGGARLPIVRIHGLIMTSVGLGMVVDRIEGVDGTLAPTLYHLVKTGAFAERHRTALARFIRVCRDTHVVFGDVHRRNLVYTEARDPEGEFVCIDGFGEKALIPIHRWSRFFNARKIERVHRRLLPMARQTPPRPCPTRGVTARDAAHAQPPSTAEPHSWGIVWADEPPYGRVDSCCSSCSMSTTASTTRSPVPGSA